MSQNRRWINTRVEYQWDSELQQYVEISAEGYWYDGPMSLAHNAPNIDQDSYAWYNDGTESGSTIIGTANNSQSLDADTTYLVRFLLQEDNGGDSSNFIAQLEYDVNNSGTFTNVSAVSNSVRAVTSTSLEADGSHTTQRLGAGTFLSVNGGVDNGDGTAGGADLDFTGNTEAEVVYAIQLVSADLTNGDTVRLRVAGANTFTNTANATAVIVSNVSVTMQDQSALSVTNGTLSVQALVNTDVSMIADSASISNGTLSVTFDSPVDVTLNNQSALLITDSTMSVQANIDTAVSMVPDSLLVSDSALSIEALVNSDITLIADALSITEGIMSVDALSNTMVSLTPSSLSVTNGALTVLTTSDIAIDTIPDAISMVDGSLAVQSNVDTNVSLTSESIAILDGTLSISLVSETLMTMSPISMTITDSSLSVVRDRAISMAADTISITDSSLSVEALVNSNINLVHDSIIITDSVLGLFLTAGLDSIAIEERTWPVAVSSSAIGNKSTKAIGGKSLGIGSKTVGI